jgi:hypothetical protein
MHLTSEVPRDDFPPVYCQPDRTGLVATSIGPPRVHRVSAVTMIPGQVGDARRSRDGMGSEAFCGGVSRLGFPDLDRARKLGLASHRWRSGVRLSRQRGHVDVPSASAECLQPWP